jgi:lambda family phage portal protein
LNEPTQSSSTGVADDVRRARADAVIARANAETEYYRIARETMTRQYGATFGGAISSSYGSRLDTPWSRGDLYQGEVLYQDGESLGALADRANRLEGENLLACGVLDRSVENIVGATIRVEPRTIDKLTNKAIKRRWKKWAGTTACDVRNENNFGSILRLLQRGKIRDGDCGLLLTFSLDANFKRRPKLQIIERHRIESPPGTPYGRLPNGNQINDGIELDPATGRPVAYHIRYTDVARVVRYQRVDARDFIFVKRSTRYSNVRGESAFRGGFSLFDQIMGLLEAVITAARVGASQAMIQKRKNPAAVLAGMRQVTVPNADAAQVQNQRWQPIQPGMINVIGTDEDLVAFNPAQPQQQFPAALDAFCRILGTKFGLTLEQVLLNFSQTTYSSGKMAQNQARVTAGIEQEDLASLVVGRIYQWWISLEIEAGEIKPPAGMEDVWAHEWIPPARPSPEPLKDVQAREKALALGIDSRSNFAMEDGYDFEEICEQNERDLKIMADHNIPVHTDQTPELQVGPDGQIIVTGGKGQADALAAAQPLNGAQITAAVDLLVKVREQTLPPDSAKALLQKIGFDEKAAGMLVDKIPVGLHDDAGDVAFKREVLKALLAVPAAREAIYNGSDIGDLIEKTGIKPEVGYEAPYIPVVAPAGQLVSGAVINDPQGNVVGGDIENELPPDAPGNGGATRNTDPTPPVPPVPAAQITITD